MQLKQESLLQGGKYKIERMLGQGGFGITYLGEQTSLGRKVAIKEFFMKELCNRDEATNHVSVGSEGSREIVGKFREKFLKEARNIARLEHPNIVSVIDVFEENGTAYYVMKYCDGGSLSQLIKTQYPSGMPENLALRYIREVASALDYIHQRKMNHLDVKPGNIMLNESEHAVLIDFGLSKQYDAETGQQTSTTPVGISEGYAPMEQYKKGGVGRFSPSTDIYALGATLYKLITGQTPPSAPDLGEEGLPEFYASALVKRAVVAAMQRRRADRPQSISGWLNVLDSATEAAEEPEVTIIAKEETKKRETSQPQSALEPQPKPSKSNSVLYGIIAAAVIALCILLFRGFVGGDDTVPPMTDPVIVDVTDTTATGSVQEDPTPAKPEQPEPEAAGYDVAFTCNVPSATLYIDGKASGSANDTHFLKTGNHTIKVTAEGYKEHAGKITVDSQTQPYKIKMTAEPAVPSANATTGMHQGHEWVDLGLPSGTKWATKNIGASSPSDYGGYYAWGETRTKSNYEWSNCFDCLDSTGDSWGTYKIDGKTRITPNSGHDTAREIWGGKWRTPTDAENDELCKKCEWTWTTQGGHIGYKVTGPNGNSIFLPAAGYRYGTDTLSVGELGYYWSSTLGSSLSYSARFLYFGSGGHSTSLNCRRSGRSVRPVTE